MAVEAESDIWSMFINGSSTQKDVRVGILLIGPCKDEFKYSIKFMFPITNNVMEYEALLVGLRLARRIRVQKIKVFADSQLVVQQVTREYEVKDLFKRYNELVKKL